MNRLSIFTVYILFVIVYSASYQTIQKQYKQLRLQTISTLIPTITLDNIQPPTKVFVNIQRFFNITSINLQQQLQLYSTNYRNYLNVYGQNGQKWISDPELNSIFNLNHNNQNQSFILKGKQNSVLALQITVSDIDTLNTQHQGVTIIITNLSGLNYDIQQINKQDRIKLFQSTLIKNIQYQTQIRKHLFLSIPFSSDIYQVWIVRQPQDGQNFTGVHVSLQMSIDQQPIPKQQNEKVSLTLEQEQQMVNIMKRIVEENNLTFLDSLQIWQKVQDHRKQHQSSYQWNEAVQWYECLGILLLYVVEYGILRFIARKKDIV